MDHIPPKLLFSRPLPNNLITVPACNKCNNKASKDDEYFRLVLQAREEVEGHPDVIKCRGAFFRSLQKPEAKGMRSSFLRSIVPAEHITPSGIFIKDTLAIVTETERVFRVVARIIRGLFYEKKRRVLPGGYEVVVSNDHTVDKLPADQKAGFYENCVKRLLIMPPTCIGNGVFSYRFGTYKNDPNETCWLLMFYEKLGFYCVTCPTNRLNPTTPV